MTTEHHVRPGQTWADCDPRCEGRTLRVEAIEQIWYGSGEMRALIDYAVCLVLTRIGGKPATSRRVTRIRVSNMRPTSTGYRLVADVPA
jgi:hypothetical protein